MTRLDRFRQMLFPREFQIPDSPWKEGEVEQLEQIAVRVEEMSRARIEVDGSRDQARIKQKRNDFLSEIGTGLWRLRQKMTQPGTDKPTEEMRRAYRHLESIWDTLQKDGVNIYDHTGQDFDAGKSLKVLAFQPSPGLRRERVIETIKPTVYVGEEMIQMGEVIVGTPEINS
jgi:hypothetical protein